MFFGFILNNISDYYIRLPGYDTENFGSNDPDDHDVNFNKI